MAWPKIITRYVIIFGHAMATNFSGSPGVRYNIEYWNPGKVKHK